MPMIRGLNGLVACAVVTACGAETNVTTDRDASEAGLPFNVTAVASLDEPWAMTFLPNGRLLVTEKKGALLVVTRDGAISSPIAGTPEVHYGGQGGLGDVVLHPDYASNKIIYLSFAEAGDGNVSGAAVMRAKLALSDTGGELDDQEVIWRQEPKVRGRGHYGHRIAFSSDGMMYITSGDRQKFTPAQDLDQNLGKIIRLHDDGSTPASNPFAARGDITAQVWSLGHRNPLGLSFDGAGRLWSHEMGPRHGDELNLVLPGANYGWPLVSNGNHYDGRQIPKHDSSFEFVAPEESWVPAISPAGLLIYSGGLFPDWKGDAFLGGLSARALIRVRLQGDTAAEAERFDLGQRIREVEQGPDGAIWLLEDGRGKKGGRLLRLSPVSR